MVALVHHLVHYIQHHRDLEDRKRFGLVVMLYIISEQLKKTQKPEENRYMMISAIRVKIWLIINLYIISEQLKDKHILDG